jgi:hypothetical protein
MMGALRIPFFFITHAIQEIERLEQRDFDHEDHGIIVDSNENK